MRRLHLVILITLLGSYAATTVSRGVYFFTKYRLGFSEIENLCLALGFGLVYIIGALVSHPLAARYGERRVLAAALLVFAADLLALTAMQNIFVLVPAVLLYSSLQGLMWPIVESYISAGRTPRETARAVGYFNLSWSGMVPLAVASAGPFIDLWPPLLFGFPGLCLLLAFALVWRLEARPVHLPLDHPDRPPPDEANRYRLLLLSSRWQLMISYSMLFVLVPLLPIILEGFGLGVVHATLLASLLDLARFLAFLMLWAYAGWHGKVRWVAAGLLLMPAGFLIALLAPDRLTLALGIITFGFMSGIVYYCALYYAMVVKNASVDAGGKHEALIGTGFAVGPAVGLVKVGLAGVVGGAIAGTLWGTSPLIALGLVAGSVPLALAVRNHRKM